MELQSMIAFRKGRRSMLEAQGKSSVAIVGGGLVGALAACFFAKRGYNVCVYEFRGDIRVEDLRGQSIDLALSARGREALRAVGLESVVLQRHALPMRARMIHRKDGSLREFTYDSVNGNCIYSVSRRRLNIVLLDVTAGAVDMNFKCKTTPSGLRYRWPFEAGKNFTVVSRYAESKEKNVRKVKWYLSIKSLDLPAAAEKYSTVKLRFNVKLVDADLEAGKMRFLNTRTQRTEDASAELIIGADGAYSTIRRIMTKRQLFDCSQTYIEHGYIELFLPPSPDNHLAMSENHLHIWPRGEFMMIALPNDDRSFTCNLFAPFARFGKIRSPEDVVNFYAGEFPDLLELIGAERLVRDYFERQPKTLVSVKCKPYHVGKSALIIGDAAHAMVPFYAQGMNAGFEDVLLLDELMDLYDCDMAKVLPKFSERRCDDAHAICDLAMYNYLEMRDLVTRWSFVLRRFLDNFLYRIFPSSWIPLYHTVHFSRMSFRGCIANRQWQDKMIRRSLWCAGFAIIAILSVPLIGKF